MTREEELDWLCRLRSEIYVYMPKEWLIPMNNALDMAISALSENKGEWIPCREREPHGFSFVALDEFNNYPWVCNSLFTWEDKDGVKHFYDATGYQDTILQGGVKAFLRGKKCKRLVEGQFMFNHQR